MVPEQQQRILGYFIEEAKDHLNTIEQGLLNLQATIGNPEMANELFRAAHSVKGGAAMLGIESMQRTSHRMEDYFKLLKESPIQVDRSLESMFLKVFDALQELLEQLQGPFGLTEDKEQSIMADVEPVFQQLQDHLERLVAVADTNQPPREAVVAPAAVSTVPSPRLVEESALKLVFSSDVSAALREMLARFKQADTDDGRAALEGCCRLLERFGEQFNLPTWMNLVKHARWAVCDRNNDYRTLAPVLIKEIKKAQDLVLAGREPEILLSETLRTLAEQGNIVDANDGIDNLFASHEPDSNVSIDTNELSTLEPNLPIEELETPVESSDGITLDELLSDATTSQSGPEVGAAELTSLADLFEIGGDALDSGWQEEEIPLNEGTPPAESLDIDIAPDFEDLLNEDASELGSTSNDFESGNELADLFGDTDTADVDTTESLFDTPLDNFDSELETLNSQTDVPGNVGSAQSDESLDSSIDSLFDDIAIPIDSSDVDDLFGEQASADTNLDVLDNDLANQTNPTDAPKSLDASASLSESFDSSVESLFGDVAITSKNDKADDDLFGDLAIVGDTDSADDLFSDLGIDNAPVAAPSDENLVDLSDDLDELDLFDSDTNSADDDLFGDLTTAGDTDSDDDALFSDLGIDNAPVAAPSDENLVDLSGLDELELSDSDIDSANDHLFGDLTTADDTDSADDALFNDLGIDNAPVAAPSDENLVDLSGLDELELSDSDTDSANDDLFNDDLFGDLTTADDTDSADDLFSDLGIDNVPVAAPGDENLVHLSGDLGELELSGDLGELEELTASDNINRDESAEIDLALPDILSIEPDLENLLEDTPESDIQASDEPDLENLLEDTPESGIQASESVASTEYFFTDASDSATAGTSDTDPQSSEFDDFFSLDDASSSVASVERESDSLNEDLWEIDSTSNMADPAASQSSSDDLSADLWADPEQSIETSSTSAASIDFDQSESGNDIATFTQSPTDENSEIYDVWASVEDLELEDEVSEDGGVSETEEQRQTDASSSDIELDALLSGNEDEGIDTELDNLLSNNVDAVTESDSDLDALFGETDILLEVNSEATDGRDINPDEQDINPQEPNLDLGGSSFDTNESNPDLSILSEPSVSAIDFDLLDLEDDGIVTGFVTDNQSPESSVEPAATVEDFFDPAENQASDSLDLEALDSLLSEPPQKSEQVVEPTDSAPDNSDEFSELEALIESPEPSLSPAPEALLSTSDIDDEFGDLEALLQDTDQTLAPTAASSSTLYRPTTNRLSPRRIMTDQTMRVSVNHLDNLSNLVGELVVNRNTLEQDQERLRQFLDNLLFQVQQLNDVGQRMRDLYERSLLESSLISSRQSYQMTSANAAVERTDIEDHATGESFDALEMDRFTGFHTLSQEMIELIVRVRESASDIAYTVESSDQVTRQFRQVTNQLQEGLNKARMVPFAQTASRLPRAVRDISLKCGKEARLAVEGRDILIDKMILEQLYDPMTHLVNNAITHGVETPEERRRAGKAPEGLITVRAFYQGNQTVISVGDDGAGIDPDVVKRKAMEKGLISQADVQAMTVLDVYDLLFHPGFSTRDQADDFAGRGFGMDVVRTSLADIRGNITIDSELGRGTNFTIRLPLTLSISKALSCISNQARIAFPMDGVEDMFDVSRERVQRNDQGQDCILWRDTLLPFQNLSDLLSFNRTLGRGRVYGGNQDENMISIVVLRSANSFIALEVDQVMGEQEIVIKQLEGPVPKPTGIAGATVLGDGRVMPIADVLELIDLAMGRVRREPNAALWAQSEEAPPEEPPVKVKSEPTVLIVDDSITVRELLSMSFNKVGYRVEQARDGQEAWEKLRSGLPCDLVFCDIEMPRMDGLELLSRLQKDGGLQQIPIAMLTSRGADRHRQMAVDLGASGYFTKPYLEEALLDAANKMLHGEKLV